MNKIYDVVIIGGGPAGCAAAINMLNNGVKNILLIDKDLKPHHRIGEILLTQTTIEMGHLKIGKEMNEYAQKYNWNKKFAACYVYGSDRTPWVIQNNHPVVSGFREEEGDVTKYFKNEDGRWHTFIVKRHEFDFALREIVQKRGGELLEGQVIDIGLVGNDNNSFVKNITVNCNGVEKKITSKFFMDCTGQSALFAHKMGKRFKVGESKLQSRYCYFKNVNFEKAKDYGFMINASNIVSFEDGWSWIAYLGDGITSFGIVSQNWEQSFWEKFENLPEKTVFDLDKAQIVDHEGNEVSRDKFYAHPDYRFRSEIIWGKNWISAGDAAMFLDPLLSQGVTLAFSFARKASNTLIEVMEGADSQEYFYNYEKSYLKEIEVLNIVVSQWYNPETFNFDNRWGDFANKLNRLFGREIKDNIEAFRWISNLENIHIIQNFDDDKEFLLAIEETFAQNLELIREFENKHLGNKE